MLWLENVNVVGEDRYDGLGGFSVSHGFYTNSDFSDLRHATGHHGSRGSGCFVRGCNFERIGEKAIRAAYVVINTAINDVDAGSTSWHASAISNPLLHDNRIYHSLRLGNLNSKGFAFRSEAWNLHVHRDVVVSDIDAVAGEGVSYLVFLGGRVKNMLFQNSSFAAKDINRVWAYRLGLRQNHPSYFNPELLVFRNVLWNGTDRNVPRPFPLEGVHFLD